MRRLKQALDPPPRFQGRAGFLLAAFPAFSGLVVDYRQEMKRQAGAVGL